ncbi:MAG: ATP-binding protein [Pseudomonadales bacterium]|nr:ATP-binding protein [Pseudomonadales bacterium]
MSAEDRQHQLQANIDQLTDQVDQLQQQLEQMEEVKRNSNRILQNAIDPILIISGDTFIECNGATVKILGATKKEQVLSTHPSELSPESQPDGQPSYDKANKMMSTAFEKGFHRFEWVHKKLNGDLFPVEVSLTRIEMNGENVLHTLWKDLSNQKKIESSLRFAIKKSDQANRAKSEFLSRMSHELRTPLNAILGFAQLMKLDKSERLSASSLENINQILSSGHHLLDLINDVLDLSKVETGKINVELESICLNDLLEECVGSCQASLGMESGIEITNVTKLSNRELIYADKTRMREVILNLLSNALKYSPDGGVVMVSCEFLADEMIRVRITDTGIGIPEEKQSELFEPFSRLGLEKTAIEGTGIGLSITKRLVELMSGRIGFESKDGIGSSFWVDIPLVGDVRGLDDSGKARVSQRQQTLDVQARVVYVEDNLANIMLMRKIMAAFRQASLTVANNAEEGIELVRETKPDIVILDINLPGMSGWDALRILKQMPETAEIPVIALTAAATNSEVQQGLDDGFEAYLIKPVDIFELADTMQRLLGFAE